MSTTIFRNKNLVRPKKGGKAKRQRQKAQRKRLMELGVPEDVVRTLNPDEVRAMLKRPAQVKKQYAE